MAKIDKLLPIGSLIVYNNNNDGYAGMISVWNHPQGLAQPELQKFVNLASIMGHEQFASSLLGCLEHWVSSRYFSLLRMTVRQPQLLLTGTLNADSRIVLRCGQAYAGRYHLHDPLFVSMQQSIGGDGGAVVGHLLAEDIEFAPYREDIYLRHGLIERLSTLYWDSQGIPVQFSLYRQREQGYFKDAEIDSFAQMSPALLQLLKGHLALCREQVASSPWQQRLREREPALTAQELEVCACLLQGMTHAGIAAQLRVKESTIKTYRNRAFDRLGIHFRSELFAMFLPG